MSGQNDAKPNFRDPIELAEELFGPKTAALMRKRMREAKPCSVEIDPATGCRSYSHEDD